GAGLDRPVVTVVEARAEAIGSEPVGAAKALGRVLSHPFLVNEFLEPGERRFGGADACLRLLANVETVVFDPQSTDDEGQREPLSDQRDEYHRECEEDDEVAPGEGLPGVGPERKRERSGERDGTPHPSPGEEDPTAPAGNSADDPLRRG